MTRALITQPFTQFTSHKLNSPPTKRWISQSTHPSTANQSYFDDWKLDTSTTGQSKTLEPISSRHACVTMLSSMCCMTCRSFVGVISVWWRDQQNGGGGRNLQKYITSEICITGLAEKRKHWASWRAMTYQIGERSEKVAGRSFARLHFSTYVGHTPPRQSLAINTHDAGWFVHLSRPNKS